ncbi:MAG TPA: aminotransferase class IV [Anaerolineales bacterium]|nr:aminotransferase class IV [Anaerolineales bacterium]
MSSISAWHLKGTKIEPISLEDQSSLDSITRQLPDGYYSTFRTFDGGRRVLGLDAHLRRLYEPVSAPDVDEVSLRRQLRALLEPDRPGEARVRLVMTKQGEAYIAIEPLKTLPREVYENGVRVETTELHRQHPRLKSTTFIARSDPKRKHIAQEGVFEALLVKDGKILEGMTSNFFYVSRAERGEILCTARDDILLGVTRQTVIGIAQGRGLEVKHQPLQRDQLSAAAEAFITSSSRGIVPVIQIDHVTVGEGRPGPITKELMESYESYVIEHSEEI